MFDTLFGMPLAARFVIAFVVVLGLIGVTAWLVRRFAANRLGGGATRGRQPRLAVIDAANIDARRKLILIRRDNIEHLLMIGGPSDIVVEPNIVRAGGARESAREPARVETRPAADTGWPLQPVNEPPRVREESWLAPEPPLARREPRGAPPAPHAPAAPATPAGPAADHNLAEMAQQLEAALRGNAAEPRSPAADILAPVPAPAKPAEPPRVRMRIDPRIERGAPQRDVRPEPKLEKAELRPAPPAAEPKAEIKIEPKAEIRLAPAPKVEPKPEAKFEPRLEGKPEPKIESAIEARPEPKLEPKAGALSRQDFYDNLEEEMASLLGRPPAKP